MKKIVSILGSMKTMAVLMSIFAIAIGYATFIENDYGTVTAKAEIYNARWFEVLLALLTINLITNLFTYKMFSMKKASLLIFHISFLIIILGAAITRYVGFEGTMHIREGATSSTMISNDTYFMVKALSNGNEASSEQSMYLSKRTTNHMSSSLEVDGKNVHVELTKYIPDVMEKIIKAKDGIKVAEIMITGGANGEPIFLREGSFFETADFILDFNSKKTFNKPVISIFEKDSKAYLAYNMLLKFYKMDTRENGELEPNQNELLQNKVLYTFGDSSFILKEFYPSAKIDLVSNPDASPMRAGYDAFKFNVNVDGKSKEMTMYGQKGTLAKEYAVVVDGVTVKLSYGSKILHLPFALKLVDFELERYPGSKSPASYASEVILIDDEQNINMPFRIYMNHVLQHRGYRFFQASYDRDEKGTILSVNNDPGTLPSYIGYFLLSLGMLWSLFSRHNRFAQLTKRAKKACDAKAVGALIALSFVLGATPSYANNMTDSFQTILAYDKAHAKKFGELVIQDSGGRMKPMDTLCTEILAKVSGAQSLKINGKKLSSTQVILGMVITPGAYRDLKFIKIGNKDMRKFLGLKDGQKFASFSDFFAISGENVSYKLSESVDKATRKDPKTRDLFDKSALKVDEKINIIYAIYSRGLIKMWPKPNDANNKWFSTADVIDKFDEENSMRIKAIATEYFMAVGDALKTNNWSKADKSIQKIVDYQKFYGAEVYPSEDRIRAEVFYNKANIFERLYLPYLLVGFVLLILSFVKVLRPKFNINVYSKISLGLLIVFFIAQSFGLGLRWYISGHAPWSNGYESMIYIGWATVLAGFIFSKRSSMTMASTSVLAGLILWVAHLNWMNPQVTNLVPVLNSYWLSIHVSSITASYGFLALSALLGFISILLFNIRTKNNQRHINLSIRELNSINEMSMMIGLALLTIGNFLGGVWANESWGRYWGWDPKETWALVTILIYAVVVHLRFIKSIYSEFNYAVISLLSFSSVLMTYFGVNYYLAGLHSYAKGDPVPVPDFVPITYLTIFIVIVLAFRNRKIEL